MSTCLSSGVAITQSNGMNVPVPRLLGFLASQVAAATKSWGMAAQFIQQLSSSPPHNVSPPGRDQGEQLGPDHCVVILSQPQIIMNPEERAGSWSVGGQTQCVVCDGSEQSLFPGPVHFTQGFVQTGITLCMSFAC